MSPSRSVYVSRLRRAFLLRVHPDRFRHHQTQEQEQPQLQKEQSALVTALGQRMAQSDFRRWQQHGTITTAPSPLSSSSSFPDPYPFVLEKRDGSLLRTSMTMGGSVPEVLQSMAQALTRAGVASLPTPPPRSDDDDDAALNETTPHSNPILAAMHATNMSSAPSSSSPTSSSQSSSQYSYTYPSHSGRDLLRFLHQGGHGLADEIQSRRADRLATQAKAAHVRSLYQFSAVDATDTGWSSAHAGQLFRKLLDLHEEFGPIGTVRTTTTHDGGTTRRGTPSMLRESYYPVRLVFSPRDDGPRRALLSSDDDNNTSNNNSYNTSHSTSNSTTGSSPLDVYGGVLRLNPASTPLQWLESFQLVTDDALVTIQHHATVLATRRRLVQSRLGIRLRKGKSCENFEYHAFVQRLAPAASATNNADNESEDINTTALTTTTTTTTTTLALEPISAVVESSSASRRIRVTPTGVLQLHTGLSTVETHEAVRRYRTSARTTAATHATALAKARAVATSVQQALGLDRPVTRTTPRVTVEEWMACVTRLGKVAASTAVMGDALTGCAIGVAPAGQVCHLADDGAVIVPHDWTL